ncbi:hypothetical protein M1D80_11830 [Phyllobacteriaceae bacterium JZ32]
MRNMLEKYLIAPRAPEGAGGAAEAGAGGGAPAAAAASGGNGADASAGAEPSPAAAGGAAPAPSPNEPGARPEGAYHPAELPEQLRGKDDRETIDKLMAVNKGYRERDAARQVPDKPDGYRDFAGVELPDTIKGHVEALSKDPLFDAAAKVALEEGVGKATMQKMTVALYAAAAEAGMLEPPLDIEAEKQALLPDSFKGAPKAEQDRAINARLQANEDFVKLQVANGKISQEVADHVLGMLMDSAKGNLFLEYFRSIATGGEGAQPAAGGGVAPGGDQRAALREELRALDAKRGTPDFKQADYDALMQRYRDVVGD